MATSEKQNLLTNGIATKSNGLYDEESGIANNSQLIIENVSTIDALKIIVFALLVVFECVPIILGGYILNNHYSLYLMAIFVLSVFGVMCVANQKFHYVLILLFMYGSYLFLLFAIASNAFEESNSELYHITKLKTVSVLWIVFQFGIGFVVYQKFCQPQSEEQL